MLFACLQDVVAPPPAAFTPVFRPQPVEPATAAPAPAFAAAAPVAARPKRAAGPLPRSPSKFVKGEFRESDYESDYDGRIPAVWTPHESDAERTYRPVRPVLAATATGTGAGAHLAGHGRAGGRTPTPPTEFDNPPHFGGPPRPKFEPIEKLAAVKLDGALSPGLGPGLAAAKKVQPVLKPKAIQARPPERIETLVATPARRMQPGPPPQIMFSSPHVPDTMHETSQSMRFAEATETSRRVVSMQQTTRVIKFNEKESKAKVKEPALEPFPFRPEPEHGRRAGTTPPPPKPSKFVPGEFKESDYESELEAVRFKPKWAPNESDADEPHYRKVRPPPPVKRCSSVPAHSPTSTPDFSQPPYAPAVQPRPQPRPQPQPQPAYTATTSLSAHEYQAEQKRLQRVEEMKRRFEEKTTMTSSSEVRLSWLC